MAKNESVAANMANAPIERPNTDAAKMNLPDVTFRLVANPKEYEDRQDKIKTTSRIAYVDMPALAGMATLTASIYLETRLIQEAEGRRSVKSIRFSLPKGFEIKADLPAGQSAQVEAWKERIVDEFIAWRKASGSGMVATPKHTAGYRTIDA